MTVSTRPPRPANQSYYASDATGHYKAYRWVQDGNGGRVRADRWRWNMLHGWMYRSEKPHSVQQHRDLTDYNYTR